MTPERLEQELVLLKKNFGEVDHQQVNGLHWFRIRAYQMPAGWNPSPGPVVFSVQTGYPGVQPYAFYVSADLSLNGAVPAHRDPPHQPPFPGNWRALSWTCENWRATASVVSGSNLLNWARSFAERLREGT